MRTSHAKYLFVALAIGAAGCAGSHAPPLPAAQVVAAAKPSSGVPDRDLGLSRTSVFEVPAPAPLTEEASMPGEKPLPPRISSEIPPVVPHAVSDFLPITRERNGCVDCHEVAGPKKAGEATPIPASHFIDRRRVETKPGASLAGARWVCTACHVARTDAAPLVGNDFRP
jgi:cytochrome c-type protein NapB